jgi:hypothetical protein
MTVDAMQKRTGKSVLLLIVLLQGLALLVLHESRLLNFWPGQDFAWLTGLYAFVVSAPLLLLLSLSGVNTKAVVSRIIAFSLLVGLAGFYTGSQILPGSNSSHGDLFFSLTLSLSVAGFIALLLIQHHTGSVENLFGKLCTLSWRNALTFAWSLLFVLAVWALLMLWAGLFRLIKVDFFHELFTARWFFYPILSMALGFGVLMFREHVHFIDTVIGLQQSMIRFLLVLLVVIALLFLVALPFTGLGVLWETGRGSTLILWLQAFLLLFVNAVYREQDAKPVYSRWLHWLVAVGVFSLPVYSVIAACGLWLRVDQYGWSLARCTGALIWLLLAIFSLAYCAQLLRYRERYLQSLAPVNQALAWVVLIAMLLINSPLLDFRKISADSQLARLQSGELKLDEADFYYFRYSLEKPGYDALMKFKDSLRDDQADIAVQIDRLYSEADIDPASSAIIGDSFFASLQRQPDAPLPDDLKTAISDWLGTAAWRQTQFKGASLYQMDVNGDGEDDYLLHANSKEDWRETVVFYRADGDWKMQQYRFQQRDESVKDDDTGVSVLALQWPMLRIGQRILQTDNNSPSEPVVAEEAEQAP